MNALTSVVVTEQVPINTNLSLAVLVPVLQASTTRTFHEASWFEDTAGGLVANTMPDYNALLAHNVSDINLETHNMLLCPTGAEHAYISVSYTHLTLPTNREV